MFKIFKKQKSDDVVIGPDIEPETPQSFKAPKLNPAQQRGTSNRKQSIEPDYSGLTIRYNYYTCENPALRSFKDWTKALLGFGLFIGIIVAYFNFGEINSGIAPDAVIPLVAIILLLWLWPRFNLWGLPKRHLEVYIDKDYIQFEKQKYDRNKQDCSFVMQPHPQAQREKHRDKGRGSSYHSRFMYRDTFCIYLVSDYKRVLLASVMGRSHAEKIYGDLCHALKKTSYKHY